MSEPKKYLAMQQVYEIVKDSEGKPVYHQVPNRWGEGTVSRVQYAKAEGKFKAFGANGKVCSLYDTPAKARRYCGKEGHVVEMDPADCRRVDCTPQEQLEHCEARMLFWAKEADRIQQELRNGASTIVDGVSGGGMLRTPALDRKVKPRRKGAA